MTATFGHAAVDNFAVALVIADMPDEDVTEMFRAGYHASEIAERVSARSGLDVTEAHTAAWLTSEGGFDACPAIPDGRSMCEQPVHPTATRCRDCERTN